MVQQPASKTKKRLERPFRVFTPHPTSLSLFFICHLVKLLIYYSREGLHFFCSCFMFLQEKKHLIPDWDSPELTQYRQIINL